MVSFSCEVGDALFIPLCPRPKRTCQAFYQRQPHSWLGRASIPALYPPILLPSPLRCPGGLIWAPPMTTPEVNLNCTDITHTLLPAHHLHGVAANKSPPLAHHPSIPTPLPRLIKLILPSSVSCHSLPVSSLLPPEHPHPISTYRLPTPRPAVLCIVHSSTSNNCFPQL